MPKPPRYALFKSKKERIQHLQEAWRVQREIMLDPNASPGVRLDASEKRLDRLMGKATQRLEVVEETGFHRQMMEQLRRTPEGREAVRELTRRMIEGLKPPIEVTNTEDDGLTKSA